MAQEGLELGLEEGVAVVLFLVGRQHLYLQRQAVRVRSRPTHAHLAHILLSYWPVLSLMLAQPPALCIS